MDQAINDNLCHSQSPEKEKDPEVIKQLGKIKISYFFKNCLNHIKKHFREKNKSNNPQMDNNYRVNAIQIFKRLLIVLFDNIRLLANQPNNLENHQLCAVMNALKPDKNNVPDFFHDMQILIGMNNKNMKYFANQNIYKGQLLQLEKSFALQFRRKILFQLQEFFGKIQNWMDFHDSNLMHLIDQSLLPMVKFLEKSYRVEVERLLARAVNQQLLRFMIFCHKRTVYDTYFYKLFPEDHDENNECVVEQFIEEEFVAPGELEIEGKSGNQADNK